MEAVNSDYQDDLKPVECKLKWCQLQLETETNALLAGVTDY